MQGPTFWGGPEKRYSPCMPEHIRVPQSLRSSAVKSRRVCKFLPQHSCMLLLLLFPHELPHSNENFLLLLLFLLPRRKPMATHSSLVWPRAAAAAVASVLSSEAAENGRPSASFTKELSRVSVTLSIFAQGKGRRTREVAISPQ